MRKICLMLLMGILFTSMIVQASAEFIQVQCPADFRLKNVDVSSDGTVLLAGDTGKPSNPIAVLLNCDVFGTVSTQWSVQEARGYRDAKFLENDTIIAACNMYKDTVGFLRVQKISNGTVDWESESMQNLMGIFPTDDSYFVSCQRDGKSAMIQKRSAQGEILWQADWDEPISISGILPGEQQHIAYGYIPNGEGVTGWIVALSDEDGSILWRHDTSKNERFVDAVWDEDGNPVLVGNTAFVGHVKDKENWHPSFVVAYNAGGEMWRTGYHYYKDGYEIGGGNLTSILATETGYFVSAYFGKNDGVRVLYLDKEGTVYYEEEADTGEIDWVSFCSLISVQDEPYVVVSGHANPDPERDYIIADMPIMTALYKVTPTIMMNCK